MDEELNLAKYLIDYLYISQKKNEFRINVD